MNIVLVLPYYFVWHYTSAFKDITNLWKNFLLFTLNFFSITTLLETLFSPWMRINDSYKGSESLFETFIFNSLMRVFGILVRLIFILLGLAIFSVVFISGILFYFVWIALPLLLVALFSWSIGQIFI